VFVGFFAGDSKIRKVVVDVRAALFTGSVQTYNLFEKGVSFLKPYTRDKF
jgi:hypothetical protein